MNSYISQYNDLVEKKCIEQLKVKKNKTMKDILSGNAKYNSEFNGFVAVPTLTKEQFVSGMQNAYQYLGEGFRGKVAVEDIYEKVFSSFTFEEFAEFLDLVAFGGYNNLLDAFNAFYKSTKPDVAVTEEVIEVLEEAPPLALAPSLSRQPSIPPDFAPSSMLPSPVSSRSLSPVPVTDFPPLTRREFFQQQALEATPSSVFSQGLVPRRGAPPLLELPTEVKEQIAMGGIPLRLGMPIQLTASPEAESIFRAMGE